ncbi:hypothetical protein AHAS_Ahas18G0186800 [Arachis hypogaea]
MPTSNHSKATVDRAVMIHYIILSNEVEVHQVIPHERYKIAEKAFTSPRLAFPHLIHRLYGEAGAHIDGDTPIDVHRPITRKGMEHARDLGHGPQQEPVPPPPQNLPEVPQGV